MTEPEHDPQTAPTSCTQAKPVTTDVPRFDKPYLHCTETRIVSSRIVLGPAELRDALFGWLHDHGLDEHEILDGTPIVRDPDARTITYTVVGRGRDGSVVLGSVQRTLVDVDPAPFPSILLEQPDPRLCVACGHAAITAELAQGDRENLAEGGPECETCGRTTCPDADLPSFSEPRSCEYEPIFQAIRDAKDCDYGCARDLTNTEIRLWVAPAVDRIVAEQHAAITAERDQLARWKAEALPVIAGLQELGRALGMPLGVATTGPLAVEAVLGLRTEISGLSADLTRLQADYDFLLAGL